MVVFPSAAKKVCHTARPGSKLAGKPINPAQDSIKLWGYLIYNFTAPIDTVVGAFAG